MKELDKETKGDPPKWPHALTAIATLIIAIVAVAGVIVTLRSLEIMRRNLEMMEGHLDMTRMAIFAEKAPLIEVTFESLPKKTEDQIGKFVNETDPKIAAYEHKEKDEHNWIVLKACNHQVASSGFARNLKVRYRIEIERWDTRKKEAIDDMEVSFGDLKFRDEEKKNMREIGILKYDTMDYFKIDILSVSYEGLFPGTATTWDGHKWIKFENGKWEAE